jgi:hypothetical protein
MRSLSDIVTAAKDGEMPTHEECYWAMLALDGLVYFDHHALQRLAYEDTSLVNTPVFQARESFRRRKGFYANDPKSVVGPNNDPANPDYQRQRAVFKRIADKFIDKWESERDQEGAS